MNGTIENIAKPKVAGLKVLSWLNGMYQAGIITAEELCILAGQTKRAMCNGNFRVLIHTLEGLRLNSNEAENKMIDGCIREIEGGCQ